MKTILGSDSTSPSAKSVLAQAQTALFKGDQATARILAQKTLQQDPGEVKALLILAYLSEPQESIRLLNTALKIDPQNKNTINGMRWAARKLRQEQQVHLPAEIPSSRNKKKNPLEPSDDDEITKPVSIIANENTRSNTQAKDSKPIRLALTEIITSTSFKSAFRIFRFLALKALMILSTIFIGVFITIIIVNRPVTLGIYTKPPQLESAIKEQIEQSILIFQYQNPSFYNLSLVEQEQVKENLRADLIQDSGLNLPYLPRHLLWTFNALKFDWGKLQQINIRMLPMLGRSSVSISINDIVNKHLPNTILLAASANLLIFLLGLPLSMRLSRKYGSWLDKLFVLLTPLFSIPSWVIGIILVAIFAVALKWLPVGGMLNTLPPETSLGYVPIILKHAILPVVAIFLSLFFQLVYSWRTYFIIYSEEDYVTLGKAMGLSTKRLQQQYILRPSIVYMLTSFSLLLVSFWQMTMALEVVFDWPGIGWLFIKVGLPNFWGESMYPGNMIIAISLIVVFAYLLGVIVFLLDIIYVLVDPRIHLDNKAPVLYQKIFNQKKLRQKYRKPSFGSSTQNYANVNRISNIFKSKWETRVIAARIAFQNILHSIQAFFKQIYKYPSAIIGMIIISFLIIGSLYAVIKLPYEKIGVEWGSSQIKGQALLPKLARPKWVNLFQRKKDLSVLILDSSVAPDKVTRSEKPAANGMWQFTINYTFDYEYADFPTEIHLYFENTYDKKPPFVSLTWITPDGREFLLPGMSVLNGSSYAFDSKIPINRLVNQNEHLKSWFTFGQIFPTPTHYVYLLTRKWMKQP